LAVNEGNYDLAMTLLEKVVHIYEPLYNHSPLTLS